MTKTIIHTTRIETDPAKMPLDQLEWLVIFRKAIEHKKDQEDALHPPDQTPDVARETESKAE
jgi:hypothetical protein